MPVAAWAWTHFMSRRWRDGRNREEEVMKKFAEKIISAFRTDVFPTAECSPVKYLADDERAAIMLTAEGNVYMSLGLIRTAEEMADIKKEVLRDVA